MDKSMNTNIVKSLLFFIVAGVLFFAPFRVAIAQEAVVDPATKSADIKSVIQVLENPVAREELIRQLTILAQGQKSEEPAGQVKSAASQALQGISRRLAKISESAMALASNVNDISQVISWSKNELSDPQSRQLWKKIIINLLLVIGVGYVAFYLLGWTLLRFRRAIAERVTDYSLLRVLRLLGIFCLDLLPILAFAVAAYLTLGMIGPQEKSSLVALAWINAFIIAHSILACCHLIFAPSASFLRCVEISDETANYLFIWAKRISYASVYGYFVLQAALLLGLPELSYEVLLRLLGLLITILVIVMILQNRAEVTRYLQYGADGENDSTVSRQKSFGVRNRLTQVWHLLALFYVIFLYGVWALQIEGGFVFLIRASVLTLIALFVVRLAMRLLDALFTRGLQVSEDLKNRFPALEGRANRYMYTLHQSLNAVVYFLGFVSILQTWGVNTFSWLVSETGKVIGGTIISVSGILLVAFLVWEITNSLIEGYLSRKDALGQELEASARTRTLLAVARKALTIALAVVATLMVLSELGVDIAPLLAGAGVLGLAIGFGAQKLVQDVITGVFILLEDQIAVGDVVTVGDKGGLVEAVSIRTVRLRDLAGTVHTIPFSAINVVSNMTKEFSFYVMEVGVAYRENVDEVMQVLKDLGAEMQQDEEYGSKIIEPLEVLGVDAFADSAVVIKARIKTAPIKQWWVGREFNRRMKNRFDELGIEIPFPHTTVYFGENKWGGAPSARVLVETVSRSESLDAVSGKSEG